MASRSLTAFTVWSFSGFIALDTGSCAWLTVQSCAAINRNYLPFDPLSNLELLAWQ